MRIVSFNIQHGRGRDGRVDLDRLRRSVGSLAPDVLALQEVDVGVERSHRADLATVAAGDLAVAFGPAIDLGDEPAGRYGNALAVRGTLSGVEVVALPGERGDEPRAALIAQAHLVDGTVLSVYATHLSVRPPIARRQLGAALDSLNQRPPPRVLAGDLNLPPGDVLPAVERCGLVLADARTPTFPVRFPRRRIDHVAATPDIAVRMVEVVATDVSDHRALVVTAELG